MTPSPNKGSMSSKSDSGLCIGSPRKLAARRFISVAKSRVPLKKEGDGLRRLRALTRCPVDRDLKLHRNSTLPEVSPDHRSDLNSLQVEKPNDIGILRVSSYPEINIKRQNSSSATTSGTRTCTSEPNETGDNFEDQKSSKGKLEASYLLTLEKKYRKREEKMISNFTIEGGHQIISVKSIARDSSRMSFSVKNAINKYIALSDRRHAVPPDIVISQPESDHKEEEKKSEESSASKKSRAITSNTGNTQSGRKEKKLRSKLPNNDRSAKKFFKAVKLPTPKIFSECPACLFKLFGPILLSAPHGIKLWRGGTEGRRKRIHYREIFITEIVLRLAGEINKIMGFPASFVVWDRRIAMPADFKNLDPNYLTEKQFPNSPFHEALVQFKKYGQLNKFPIMHVDVHGKKNRKTNMDLDIGFKALENHWPEQSFVKWLKSEAETQFEKTFNSPKCEKNDMRFTVNIDPSLCGDWGGDLFTMACQSVTSGIPGFQLEIPRAMRAHLIEDNSLMAEFAQAIVNIYNTCINGGNFFHISVPQKERNLYAEYLDKVYYDHIKIDRTFPEKQI
ncbi:hypothetical protein FSP39_009835 [Pinctada imbricata]|uniref:Uncharacterized protein n=1 Tax=Pinctada imbricata TaxID=66713 RepID=A0AA88Y019_PINIB|nr:hypothetical protein FSP39_009835 [Pinctada imbricata]